MTEDEAFNLIELRQRRAEEQAMIKERQEMREADEYQIRTANAKLVARDKQVAGTHYKNMGVQPWDVVDTWPLHQRIGYYRGGALKYLMRMGAKDESIAEIGKGIHYLEKLLEVLEEAAR